jgi:tripartite-type tricarboxylate transporter receptor subunit TctC
MQFGTIAPTLAPIRAGRLRALAVTGAARTPALPEVPTIAEAGLPGYECVLWQALVTPAGTAEGIIARLNREVAAALKDPDVVTAFAEQGIEPQPGTPAALGERIREEIRKWRQLIASAGIREN